MPLRRMKGKGLSPKRMHDLKFIGDRGLDLGIVAGFFVAGFDRNWPRDLIQSFLGQRLQTKSLKQEFLQRPYL